MAKKEKDNGQQKLRVVTSIDDTPGMSHVDPATGQTQLVGITKHLVPPDLKPFADFMNHRLSQTEKALAKTTEQSARLANSLEAVIPKFLDQSVNQQNPDLVFAHLNEGQEADVAIADGTNVLAESLYILSAGEIVDKIGNTSMSPTRMGLLLRDLKIFGDSKFHHIFKTSRKGKCQKYKVSTIAEIYKRLLEPEKYDISPDVASKYAQFVKPQGV